MLWWNLWENGHPSLLVTFPPICFLFKICLFKLFSRLCFFLSSPIRSLVLACTVQVCLAWANGFKKKKALRVDDDLWLLTSIDYSHDMSALQDLRNGTLLIFCFSCQWCLKPCHYPSCNLTGVPKNKTMDSPCGTNVVRVDSNTSATLTSWTLTEWIFMFL